MFPGSLAGKKEEKPMADFVQKIMNKTAVRELTTQIADVMSFNALIEGIITDNPSGCVGYMTKAVPFHIFYKIVEPCLLA